MSIGKRLIGVARANMTDFTTALRADRLRDLLNGKDDEERLAGPDLGASLGARAGRRARHFKDAAEVAWERAYDNAKARAGVRHDRISDPAVERRRWYRTLEVDTDADLRMVRRAYRRLLLQYHPDLYATDPEKQKVATEVTRRLTEAYNGLTRWLST